MACDVPVVTDLRHRLPRRLEGALVWKETTCLRGGLLIRVCVQRDGRLGVSETDSAGQLILVLVCAVC